MRKLLIFLAIFALIFTACSPQEVPPDQPDPGEENNSQQPSDPDPDPDNGDQPPEPAQVVTLGSEWEREIQRYYKTQHSDKILLFPGAKMTAVNLETNTMYIRELEDGFMLDDSMIYEAGGICINNSGVIYPLEKDGVYIEHLSIETGEIWRQPVQQSDNVKYYCDDHLVKVTYGDDEQARYFNLDTGQALPDLDGSITRSHDGSYYSLLQGDSLTLARFDAVTGAKVWETPVGAELSNPDFDRDQGQGIWTGNDAALFSLRDRYYGAVWTMAVDYSDGTVLWANDNLQLDIVGNKVLLIAEDKLSIVEIASGQSLQKIEMDLDTQYFTWNGDLYLSTDSFSKVDLETGEVIWEQGLAGHVYPYRGISPEGFVTDELGDTNLLWVLNNWGHSNTGETLGYDPLVLTAIDPESGTIVFSQELSVLFGYGAPWHWPVNLTRDIDFRPYVLLEVNSHLDLADQSLMVIDGHTGEKLWEYNYPENYSHVLFNDNSNYLAVVLEVGNKSDVQYLDKATGEIRHQLQVNGNPELMIGDRLLVVEGSKTRLINPLD